MKKLSQPVRMKAWVIDESERCGVTPKSIWHRIQRGHYSNSIKQKRINARVVFVVEQGKLPDVPLGRPTRTGLSDKQLGHAAYVKAWERMRKESE